MKKNFTRDTTRATDGIIFTINAKPTAHTRIKLAVNWPFFFLFLFSFSSVRRIELGHSFVRGARAIETEPLPSYAFENWDDTTESLIVAQISPLPMILVYPNPEPGSYRGAPTLHGMSSFFLRPRGLEDRVTSST